MDQAVAPKPQRQHENQAEDDQAPDGHVHGDRPESLSGQYWTDRNSQGELVLTAKSKTLADSFDEAQRLRDANNTNALSNS